jgi:hypothetical protein
MNRVTETTIQNDLYRILFHKGFIFIFPNMDVITGHEADLIAISRSGYAYEYEIKLSLSDFRADQKKRVKHATFSGKVREMPYPYTHREKRIMYVTEDAPINPYLALRYECFPDRKPRQFWYVVHGFQLPEKELPPYAGLIQYHDDIKRPQKRLEIIKQAPRLESGKVDEKRIAHANRNMLYRYWELRNTQRSYDDKACPQPDGEGRTKG